MPKPTSDTTSTYDQLAAPFDTTHRDRRGGVELEYITGEQCVTRLNQVLGPGGWTFQVKDHGLNAEADEFWVLGTLEATIDGALVRREQFGSNKIKRARQSGNPLDIGFDLKGAATDALKKTASLIGVGLYLSHKDGGVPATEESTTTAGDQLVCDTCGQGLQEIRFRDGTVWLPVQLASLSRRKHGHVLCMDHYREANARRARAEEKVDSRPGDALPAGSPPAPAGPSGGAPAPSADSRGVTSPPAGAAPSGAQGRPAPEPFRALTEDALTVLYDKAKELAGYTVADVGILLGRAPNEHLQARHAAGEPCTGKALLHDLIAHKREGREIPGVPVSEAEAVAF